MNTRATYNISKRTNEQLCLDIETVLTKLEQTYSIQELKVFDEMRGSGITVSTGDDQRERMLLDRITSLHEECIRRDIILSDSISKQLSGVLIS